MIVKGKVRKKYKFHWVWAVVLVLLVSANFIFSKKEKLESTVEQIICDVENVDGDKLIYKDYIFNGAEKRTTEESHSGSYSIYTGKGKKYGMSYELKNPKPGTTYIARVWRKTLYKTRARVVIKSSDNKISKGSDKVIRIGSNGWEQIEVTYEYLGGLADDQSLIMFCYVNSDTAEAYFDDLTINEKSKSGGLDKLENSVHLYLDAKALNKINKKREVALQTGILKSADDDFVKAKLTDNDSAKYDVKLRLKGDWTDHLGGDYWSYRVKMPADQSWNRLTTFSLQDPKTVILKYGEDIFWEERMRNDGSNIYYGTLYDAEAQAYKLGKTLASPKLKEQFDEGIKLLDAYRYNRKPIDEIFDIERYAKLFAIAEILEAYHGLIWHNQRFYYNPISTKLEPIGYDGYTDNGPYKMYSKLFFGEFKTSTSGDYYDEHYKYLFKDRLFNESYVKYLLEFSQPDYLESFFKKYSSEMDLYLTMMLDRDINYNYDQSKIFTRAASIRKNIIPYGDFSMKAYRKGDEIFVSNRHPLPLTLLGSGPNKLRVVHEIDTLLYTATRTGAPVFVPVIIPKNHKYIYFQLDGHNEIYTSPIQSWTAPGVILGEFESEVKHSIPLSKDAYKIEGDNVVIFPGEHSVDKPIIIGKGYTLSMSPGIKLDFTNRAYLLSYGPLILEGAEGAPITITSSDKSSQGVVVLCDETSKLNYVNFNNLGALEEGKWQFTGAVTFHEGKVYIDNVTISNNSCEDALNLVRAYFEIANLNINNTFADGFDGDFCNGRIKDSYFYKTGNDGLDFSGSKVSVINVNMKEIGDKGISAGEQATLFLRSAKIDGANIGLASKDLSKVVITNVDLINCKQGFAAYKKKPEFGGGTIEIKAYKTENVDQLFIKDDESKILFPK